MKTMHASAVRGAFAKVLEAVRQKAEAVVVVRYGRPVAALVPLDRLAPHELSALERVKVPGGKPEDPAR
jgi:prevent-host-death family protein